MSVPRMAALCACVACLSAAGVPAAQATGLPLALVSNRHPVFDRFLDGVRGAARESLEAHEVASPEDREDAARLVRTASAVVALGSDACRVAREAAGGGSGGLVLFTYQADEANDTFRGALSLAATLPLAAHRAVLPALLPKVRRVAVWCRSDAVARREQAALAAAGAQDAPFEARCFVIEGWSRLRAVTDAALAYGDAVWLPADGELTPKAMAHLLERAYALKKPVLAASPRVVRAGALAGLVPDPVALGARAARWLAGRGRAADPAEQPGPTLYVNPRAAAALGLSLPAEAAGLPARDVLTLQE